MLRTEAALLDLQARSLDALPQLSMDLMTGDKSIVRRVFGNIRRLQPDKPVTKAQAAVALSSGRMAEMIKSEILRLEVEHQSRLAEMEEIRDELMRRGEIPRIWEERFSKEKEREFEVERDCQLALLELENERMTRNKGAAEYMKRKAALDYQQQLLSVLRKEVDEMCERLATHRADVSAEQQSLDVLLADLHSKQNAITEAKSMLEAEKEALRILRYWLEEEAWKIHVRGKNLEEAARRWKWNPDSGNLG